MKILCIITTTFPYGTKESFLESEIIHNYGFDKVIFMSSRAEGKLRELPNLSNLYYYRINALEDNYRKFFINALFSNFFWKEFFFLLLFSKRFSIYNLKLLLKETLLGINTFKKAKEIIDANYNGFESDDVVFYSYWLSDHALSTYLLSNHYKSRFCCSRTHRFDLYEEESRGGYLPYRQLYLNNIDTIIPIAQDGVNYLNKYSYKKNIKLFRLGVDDNGINPHEEASVFTIVSCSWCQPVKRIDLIIRALSNITEKKIKWIHFGNGQLLEDLKLQASIELKHNINFCFLGEVSNSYILDFYRHNHVDLFLNVSASEGIPVSIMEAISFGIPVIATDVGGTSEIVKDNISGFLMKKDFEILTLTELIIKVINLKEESELLRTSTRQFWELNYNSKINYREFYDFLNSKIKKNE